MYSVLFYPLTKFSELCFFKTNNNFEPPSSRTPYQNPGKGVKEDSKVNTFPTVIMLQRYFILILFYLPEIKRI